MRNVFLPSVPVANWEIVEIPVASGATRAAVPDQPMLKSFPGKRLIVKSIGLITAKILSHAPLSGVVNAAVAEFRKITLVVYVNGWERLHFIPLLMMNGTADADSTAATTVQFVPTGPMNFDGVMDVDWTKSYLQFSTGLTAASAYSVLLGVNYVSLNDEGLSVKPK